MEDDVLLAYARAMRSAQRLEGRMQLLFGVQNVAAGISATLVALTVDQLDALLTAADRKTLGEAVRGVVEAASRPGPGLPDAVEAALRETVGMRNFIAHHYFSERRFLRGLEGAAPVLVAELNWFSEVFEAWVPSMDRWTDTLLKTLGFDEDDHRLLQEAMERAAPSIGKAQLDALRTRLAKIGVDVPPLPASPTAESP